MKINANKKIIEKILSRGIIKKVLPSLDQFQKRLLSGDRLKFYIGADPTSTALHLSHAKNYMLLEEFRTLGHEVIVLFGDFTARIGDPTEKGTAREQLSEETISNNVHGWLDQIKPLMNFNDQANPPRIAFNREWLSKLVFEDVLQLASNFSVQQMLERDMFEKRLKEKKPIYLHEFMYPLMQGYDSVALEVDIELCGTDQIFNALVGRTLLKRMKNRDKFVVAVNLMENPLTGDLMSKSRGTGVFLDSSPFDMYGSIMAQPDEMIKVLLVNNTRLPLEKINDLKNLENPRDGKQVAALEITKIFHGEDAAKAAEQRFIAQIQKKEVPENVPEVPIGQMRLPLIDVISKCVPNESTSNIRRLIKQSAIKIDGQKITNFEQAVNIPPQGGLILHVGKKRIYKITN